MIIVDQLEELFTQEQLPASEREAFVAALEALAKSGLVWVVATHGLLMHSEPSGTAQPPAPHPRHLGTKIAVYAERCNG